MNAGTDRSPRGSQGPPAGVVVVLAFRGSLELLVSAPTVLSAVYL